MDIASYAAYGGGIKIMKNNNYKKLYSIDRFARKFYCNHARLNQLRLDKKRAKRKVRRDNKNFEE